MGRVPEFTKECYADPKWGSNPDAQYDCGKPFGEIWKFGWAGLKDKWPGAYKAIKAFTIDYDEMGKMITEVDLNGKRSPMWSLPDECQRAALV